MQNFIRRVYDFGFLFFFLSPSFGLLCLFMCTDLNINASMLRTLTHTPSDKKAKYEMKGKEEKARIASSFMHGEDCIS